MHIVAKMFEIYFLAKFLELVEIKRTNNRLSESWRKCKKLGTLLEDHEDIARRKSLATAASISLKKSWSYGNRVALNKRIQLCNSMLKSVFFSNSQTWALTKTDQQKIATFHRNQLRSIPNIRYPARISNQELYTRTESETVTFEILRR